MSPTFAHHLRLTTGFRHQMIYHLLGFILIAGVLGFLGHSNMQILPCLGFILMTQGLHSLFAEDVRCGWIDVVLSQRLSLEKYVFGRLLTLGSWYLLLTMPQIMIWFGAGASPDQLLRLLVATLTTGASLFGLGVTVGSLALGARQPGMLMLLLMLPLGLPALIIFQASIQAIMESLPFLTLWGLQAGLFLMTFAMALVITPFSIRQAIR